MPLGAFGEIASPLSLPTDVRLLDILLEAGGEVEIPIPFGHVAFVVPIDGEVSVDGQPFSLLDPKAPVNLPQGPKQVVMVQAKNGAAKAVVFSGTPLNQPVHWQGPMALASPAALSEAAQRYQRGLFGSLQTR